MKFNSEEELTKWAMDTTNLWLFLDYDGTLSGFAPTPNQLYPNPKIIDLVQRLSQRKNTRVTIISGRRLKDVRTLLPISGLFLGGTYGIELLTPSGETIHQVEYDDIRPLLETIKPQWERLIFKRKGFFLEDKGWTLALHARFANDIEADEVLASAGQLLDLQKITRHFRILGGHKFLEIAPLLANKRKTIEYLIKQFPLPDTKYIYIGDDDKDEEAFPAIRAVGGVTIKVTQFSQLSQETTADYIFASPQITLQWLDGLVK